MFYPGLGEEVIAEGAPGELPLYGLRPGVGVGVVAGITGHDFYLFFVEPGRAPTVRL